MPVRPRFCAAGPIRHAPVTFDVLTEVLEMLRIRTTLYAVALVNGQWGVRFTPYGGAYIHVLEASVR